MEASWRTEEQQKWTSSVCSPTLRYIVYGFLCKIASLSLVSSIAPLPAFLLAFTCLLVHSLHRYLRRSLSLTVRRYGAVGLLEVYQWLLACLSMVSCPSQGVYYGIASAALCINYQVSLTSSRPELIFTLSRLFLMWRIVSTETIDDPYCYFPFCLYLMMAILTLGTTEYYQSLAKDRFQANQLLRDKERKIASLMQAIPDGVLVLTQDMAMHSYNDALLALLSTYENSLEQVFFDLEYAQGMAKGGEKLAEDVGKLIDSEGDTKDLGTTLVQGKWLEWRGRKCAWEGEKACILTVRDNSQLIAVQTELTHESAYKSSLIRSVSHELRTPTNAIINLIHEVLDAKLDHPLPQPLREDLSLASTCSHFLLSMINDLLDYSKVLAGKFALLKGEVVLREELQRVLKLFGHQCRAKGIDLRVNVDPYLPSVIFTDATRMKQILLNLLSNALKFTSKGCIRVLATLPRAGVMQLSVSDTGIGIPVSKQSQIFSLFGKLEGNDAINPQGSGLGLGISNLLAKELGGEEIEVSSEEGCGTTFSFKLFITERPVVPSGSSSPMDFCLDVPSEFPKPISLPPSSQSPNSLSSLKPRPPVLIVDDSDFNRLVLRRILGSLGITCDEEATGLQAVRRLSKEHRRSHSYSLVLMDVEMPEMDGITAAKRIGEMEESGEIEPGLRVVACSAYCGEEDKEACEGAGMRGYLEKPVSRETVRRLLVEAKVLN